MEIYWEVEDGYVGKSRPQSTDVPDEEIEACDTVEEAEQLITDYVQEDFDIRCGWYFSSYDRMIEEIKEKIEEE